jgi:S1-C subfamily serine protease
MKLGLKTLKYVVALAYAPALMGCAKHPIGEATQPVPTVTAPLSSALTPLAKVSPAQVALSVCHIITNEGSHGSCFVLNTPNGEPLVVTAYHVVADAQTANAELVLASGKQRFALEIVATDAENDVAILKSGSPIAGVAGLALEKTSPVPGDAIRVYGFPYVDGSAFALTVEPGSITSVQREVDGADYLQTNAAINPGGSGGPAVNDAGRVVGIVSASAAHQIGVGLLVPVSRIQELYARYAAPATRAAAVRSRLDGFMQAARGERRDIAAFLSERYVNEEVLPQLQASVASAQTKLERLERQFRIKTGDEIGALPEALQEKLVESALSKDELAALSAGGALAQTHSRHVAVRIYFGEAMKEVFGDVGGWRLVSKRETPEETVAVIATTGEDATERRYVVRLVFERGDWQVDEIQLQD